jgi:Restriction endonuclease
MRRSPNYVDRIRSFGWENLRHLWKGILEGHTPGWPPGIALEYLLLRMFELDGAEVRWPFEVKVGDELVEQIDGAVYIGHLAFLVESKASAGAVDVTALARIRTQLARRPSGTLGLVVSMSGFTGPAVTLARYFAPQTVLLMSGAEVGATLQNESIVRHVMVKYRECVEEGAQITLMNRRAVQ